MESAAVLSLPLVALAPFQPPDAVQAVAFEACQVSTELPPERMEDALLCSDTVGLTFTVT
jgi:hypothetical protein